MAISFALSQMLAGSSAEARESILVIALCLTGALCQTGIAFSERKIKYTVNG